MILIDFEKQLQDIRAANGWYIDIKCRGIWIVEVFEKETHKFLAETGCTSFEGILVALQKGLDHKIWGKPDPPLPDIIEDAYEAYKVFDGMDTSDKVKHIQAGIKTAATLKKTRKWVIANPDKCPLPQAVFINAIDIKLTQVYNSCDVTYIKPIEEKL